MTAVRTLRIAVFLATLVVAPHCFLRAQAPALQLVESFPVGTTLDMPDIPEAKDVWIEMIRSAEKSLDIEQFYISAQKGEALDAVLEEIRDAAARGVAVRIIIDARMARTYPEPASALGKTAGITLRIIDYGKMYGGIQHSKFFIIDTREVFVGSQNFDWRALTHINEIGIRIRDERATQFYGAIFETDWRIAGGEPPAPLKVTLPPPPYAALLPPADTAWFTPTGSPAFLIPDSSQSDEPHILKLIGSAKKELRLQFLSYSPYGRNGDYYPVIDSSIKAAARRGVHVRLLVADWGKGGRSEQYLKELSEIPNIEVRYSCVPEWPGGYISFARVEHCKFIIADGETFWLGTSNAEKSYFRSSRNLGIVVANKSLTKQLARKFDRSWNSPYAERITVQSVFTPREHGEQ